MRQILKTVEAKFYDLSLRAFFLHLKNVKIQIDTFLCTNHSGEGHLVIWSRLWLALIIQLSYKQIKLTKNKQGREGVAAWFIT